MSNQVMQSKCIKVPLTAGQYELLKEEAEEQGKTIAELSRWLIAEGLDWLKWGEPIGSEKWMRGPTLSFVPVRAGSLPENTCVYVAESVLDALSERREKGEAGSEKT